VTHTIPHAVSHAAKAVYHAVAPAVKAVVKTVAPVVKAGVTMAKTSLQTGTSALKFLQSPLVMIGAGLLAIMVISSKV
jgi:hypothetical protein